MKGFKEMSFAERRNAAAKAKQANVKKFEEKASADDPAQSEKRAAKLVAAEARKARAAKREEEKAAEKQRALAAEAERLAEKQRELVLAAEQKAALEEKQKADRDARYAARKARQRG